MYVHTQQTSGCCRLLWACVQVCVCVPYAFTYGDAGPGFQVDPGRSTDSGKHRLRVALSCQTPSPPSTGRRLFSLVVRRLSRTAVMQGLLIGSERLRAVRADWGSSSRSCALPPIQGSLSSTPRRGHGLYLYVPRVDGAQLHTSQPSNTSGKVAGIRERDARKR